MYDMRDEAWGETRLYDLLDGSLKTVWRTPAAPRNTCPGLLESKRGTSLVITTALSEEQFKAQCDGTAEEGFEAFGSRRPVYCSIDVPVVHPVSMIPVSPLSILSATFSV